MTLTLGFAALHVYAMYQNISEWLPVDYLIAYTVTPTAYHICFHHKSITLVYVLEDIVIHSLYAQITSVNVLLFPDVFLWLTVFPVAVSAIVLVLLTLARVICSDNEISHHSDSDSTPLFIWCCSNALNVRESVSSCSEIVLSLAQCEIVLSVADYKQRVWQIGLDTGPETTKLLGLWVIASLSSAYLFQATLLIWTKHKDSRLEQRQTVQNYVYTRYLYSKLNNHMWLGGVVVTCDFRSRVQFPALTLPGYFWDNLR